jgi:DNA modification methylase
MQRKTPAKLLDGTKLNKIKLKDVHNSIINGEALSIMKKIPSKSVGLIITSPSYEVGKEYENGDSFEKYLQFHEEVIKEAKRILKDNGAIYWNVAQTPKNGEILPLGAIFYNLFKKHNYFLKNWIIWRFDGGLNCKKRLSGRYENVLWFVKDHQNFIFNLDDVRITPKWKNDKRNNPIGKNPTDFWEFAEDNSIWDINRVVNVSKEKTTHPCQFPEKLVERIIKASSNKNDVVLDMFNGSGTTCKVANDLGRKFIGIDKELKYCKVALDRVNKNSLNNELSNYNSKSGRN